MSISPIGSNSPITRLQGSKATTEIQSSQDVNTSSATDTVEISDGARYLAHLKSLPDVREDKVQAARASIASGKFETPDRIDGTVDRLLSELA